MIQKTKNITIQIIAYISFIIFIIIAVESLTKAL